MKIRILLLGVTDVVARGLAEEGAAAGVEVDIAPSEHEAERLLADPARRYDAVVARAWENASGVAKRHLTRDGKTSLYAASDEVSARGLIHAIAAAANARGERQEMLLAMIAHDVRAPIGVALGALGELTHPTL